MRRPGSPLELVAPGALLVLVGVTGAFFSEASQQDFQTALVMAAAVIALYVFVGNSGVISFGHTSFVAVGAFGAGVMTVPAAVKPFTFPDLAPFIAEHEIGNVESLALAAALGGVFAFLVGVPLMRL